MAVLEQEMPIGAPHSEAAENAAAGLSLALITTAAELAEIADDWNRLAGDIPFRRHEWLATWWRHFDLPKAKLQVVALRDEQRRLQGVMPWYLDRSFLFGRVLRLLGSGIVCSDYVSLLAAADCGKGFAARLAAWLDEDFSDDWDAIDLDQVDPMDPALATLVDSLRQRGHVVHERPGMHCWRISLPNSWEEYLSRFSKRRRERTRTAYRQWFEPGRAVLQQARTTEQLAAGWEILVDLHQRRRQSLGEPGCFANASFAQFLREAVARLFDAGRVRLCWLECEGRPAAAQLDFVGGDTVYGYQMGMDPELAAYEPGNLRMIGVLRQAIADGYRNLDLLRGDEPYKATWQAKPLPLVRWRIVNKQLTAHCRHRVWLGGEAARQFAKRARDHWTGRKQADRQAADSPISESRVETKCEAAKRGG